MNISGENDERMHVDNQLNHTTGGPSQVWAPPISSSNLNYAINTTNKSAYNDDRGLRADA